MASSGVGAGGGRGCYAALIRIKRVLSHSYAREVVISNKSSRFLGQMKNQLDIWRFSFLWSHRCYM